MAPTLSVTVTVNVVLPGAVGIPSMEPSVPSVSPAGSTEPAASPQKSGAVPPVATQRRVVRRTPAVAWAGAAGLITGGGGAAPSGVTR